MKKTTFIFMIVSGSLFLILHKYQQDVILYGRVI